MTGNMTKKYEFMRTNQKTHDYVWTEGKESFIIKLKLEITIE